MCFNVGFLKLCPRKEKMKREKKKAKKKAKRMQKRVSLVSGLDAGETVPGTQSWRDPAEGRVVTEMWSASVLPSCGGSKQKSWGEPQAYFLPSVLQ